MTLVSVQAEQPHQGGHAEQHAGGEQGEEDVRDVRGRLRLHGANPGLVQGRFRDLGDGAPRCSYYARTSGWTTLRLPSAEAQMRADVAGLEVAA